MKSRLATESPKTFVIVSETGEEFVDGLLQFVKGTRIGASQFRGVGGLQELTAGFFNPDKKDFNKIVIREQLEILSLRGHITVKGGQPQFHAHVVVAKGDGTAHGGHLLRAIVCPVLEVVLVETPQHLHRRLDPETGLALIPWEL